MIGSKTVCLNMIVKNESHIIIKTLENLISHIQFDYWVISDTGSTDNTKELIIEFFNKNSIPGLLTENEWVDFAHNRTLAINDAYNANTKTDYLFFFDADDSISGQIDFPNELKYDLYNFKFGDSVKYHRSLLVNNHKKWKYVGVLHEYIVSLESIDKQVLIEGEYFIDSGREGSRNKNPNKYIDDAEILSKAFNKEINQDKALASRYCFYCAQSYKDANKIDLSIEWYKKVLTLDSWKQEKYYSCLMLGDLLINSDTFEAIKYYIKSYDYDNERIEGLVQASTIFKNNDMHILNEGIYLTYQKYKTNYINRYPENKLFLFKHLYDDIIEHNYSFSTFYLNRNLELGYNCIKKVLVNNVIPSNYILASLDILYYYIDYLKKDDDTLQLFYNIQNIYTINIDKYYNDKLIVLLNTLLDKNKNSLCVLSRNIVNNEFNDNIFITFRCLESFDACCKCIESILNHWSYLNLMNNWFFIDDNVLSDDERNQLKSKYVFLTMSSINININININILDVIYDKVIESKSKYWIHLEDNYIFHKNMDYINKGIQGLTDLYQLNVKQICFNKCYARNFDEYNNANYNSINNSSDYLLHYYYDSIHNKPGYHRWKHFSLKPSITDTSVLFKMDNMSELEYANEWFTKGYLTGFFSNITYTHLQLKTDNFLKNELGLINDHISIPPSGLERNQRFPSLPKLNNLNISNIQSLPVKVVNLERRTDRKEKMIEFFNHHNITSFEFFNAIDGNNLVKNNALIDLFKNNCFGSKKGVIGCALSHVMLWTKLVNDNDNDYYIIMEDDILSVSNDYVNKLSLLEQNKHFQTNDILFLGYHMWSRHREWLNNEYHNIDGDISVGILNYNLYIGGTFSYSINKAGANKLLNYIKENGIKYEIDNFIINCAKTKDIIIKEIKPHICFSDWCEFDKNVDTDIQKNISTFDLNKIYVKMIGHYWRSSTELCNQFNLMKPDNTIIELVDHDNYDKIDYYVIINMPSNLSSDNSNIYPYFNPNRTLIFYMEPIVQINEWKSWLDTCQTPNLFKFIGSHDKYLNNVQWTFKLDDKFKKEDNVALNKVASIVSHKLGYPGHVKRVEFLKLLDVELDKDVNMYGRENYHSFNNYAGSVPDEDTSLVLNKYKYYFMGENFSEHNYATEKIWEPILCECLTFYWGCPNLEDYIDSNAFIRIDYDKPDESIKIIKQAIEENWWAQRIDVIRKEKQKILNNLGFFPRLEQLLKN